MKQEEIEILLWKYIDGQCTAEEQTYVQKMLTEDANWPQQLASLQVMDAFITDNLSLETPSAHFAENIMAQIHAPAKKVYINKWVIKGIAAFFIFSIALLLVYTLSQTKSAPVYNFNWSKLNNTLIDALIFANIIVALIFIDTLLRKKLRHR